MSETIFIEDVFINFYDDVIVNRIPILTQDKQPMASFYNLLVQGQRITTNQSNFIIRILKKYKDSSYVIKDIDLDNPVWKREFRTIDTSRKAFVEYDDDGVYWICLKFPYQLKNIVEKDILGNGYQYYGENKWDKDRRLRLLNLLDYNIIKTYEFLKSYNFEIEESFFDALSLVEEIWESADNILKFSTVDNNSVTLHNASNDSIEYFKKHSTNNINDDLFLAKQMQFNLNKICTTPIEKIASSEESNFWVRSFKQFFDITESITGTIAILLDRSDDYEEWLKNFARSVESYGIEKNNIRICFRANNTENKEFNNWVKENNFAGKIENQKYLIFLNKPPKWLFKMENSVKIIGTNCLFLPSTHISRTWFENHPCVIYLGDVKPSLRESNFVEL